MTIEVVQAVPLTLWKDGTIRVKRSRLLLDMIIDAYKCGKCPEEIYDSFPSDSYSVADFYAIIAYYLRNKSKVETYLRKSGEEAEKVWRRIEADPAQRAKRNAIRKKMAAFQKNRK